MRGRGITRGPAVRLDRVEAARELEGKATAVVKVRGREVSGTFGRREFEITSTCLRSEGVRARRTRLCPRRGIKVWGPADRVADYLLRGADREL